VIPSLSGLLGTGLPTTPGPSIVFIRCVSSAGNGSTTPCAKAVLKHNIPKPIKIEATFFIATSC
jgi:hypothetical protein